MARPSFNEYLTYLRKQPRARGWGALLVYDREKSNRLLMQEHILRAEQEAWLEPVSGEKETENGKFTRLAQITFGAPVLSFENASIASSMAALSMPVIGGKVTEWSRDQGASQPTLIGISTLDPLTAPKVKMNIKLNEAGGGLVEEDGRVTLDLSNSEGYSFEVSQWKELNSKLGELIEEKFKDPERGEQVWELNKLEPVPGDLNPTSFRVRTHSLARAGSAVASTNRAEQEEGAVIVGVAFNGDANGDFPAADEDMAYLLPYRASGASPYSMNILLDNEVWARKVFSLVFEQMQDYVPQELEFDRSSSGMITRVRGGSVLMPMKRLLSENEQIAWYVAYGEGGMGHVSFGVLGNTLVAEWNAVEPTRSSAEGMVMVHRPSGNILSNFPIKPTLKATCTFDLHFEEGVVSLKSRDDLSLDGKLDLVGDPEDPAVIDYLREETPAILVHMRSKVLSALSTIQADIEVINLLRLNGLIFRNGQRSLAETCDVPGDVTMLGDLVPTLTAFAIDPMQKTLSAGSKQRLTLSPEPSGSVVWEVKALPGESGGPEELGTAPGGEYTAPAADKITGAFRQVIVTATAGTDSSSALLTIVPKAVAVRPKLLSARYSTAQRDERYVLEGGSVDASLVWEKGPGFKGELRDPTPAEYEELVIPRDKNVKVYVAPQLSPDPGKVVGALMQLDQVEVTGAGRTETIDISVVWVVPAATLKVRKEGEALRLVLAVQSWGGDETELTPAQTQWFKVKGAGSIDDTSGTYQPGQDEGDYVIIAGIDKSSPTPVWNYAVLPMPYSEAQAAMFIEANEAFNRLQAERA